MTETLPPPPHTAGGASRRPFDRQTGERLAIACDPLPPRDRPRAALSVLDITKWFGETSGGVRTYLTEKMRYVSAREQLRHVLVIPGALDAVTAGDGVRTYRLRGPRIPTQTAYRFLLATRSTRRVIEHERPDVIEVGSPFAVPWVTELASRRLKVPMVSFHHTSVGGIIRDHRFAPVWRRATGAYLRRLDRLFSSTIVASEFAGAELRRLGIERVVRIPLGVDLMRFAPAPDDERVRTRRRLGVPDDRALFVYVGRLAPEKNLDVVIDAWPEVERRCGASLVIVGEGGERARLRARSRALRIIWLPYQGDRDVVARIHAAADGYVSPGDVETFGLSALEAMASGTPVLSAGVGAVAEHVQRSGAGMLYETRSPAAFARAALALLERDDRAARIAARRYAETEHDWETVFDRLFQHYHEVLSR